MTEYVQKDPEAEAALARANAQRLAREAGKPIEPPVAALEPAQQATVPDYISELQQENAKLRKSLALWMGRAIMCGYTPDEE